MDNLPEILNQGNCQKYRIAPKFGNGRLESILISNKTDLNFLSVLKYVLGNNIVFEVADDKIVKEEIDGLEDRDQDKAISIKNDTIHAATDNSVIELIDETISEAIRLKASDIHLEPFENEMSVRYRLDGVLQPKGLIKKENVPAVISRVKIMSGLDIAEKRRPQDGRIRFGYENRTIDIRVSVLPTDFGEKIVMRLLDKAALRLDLNELGFNNSDLELLKRKIKLPNGIILITGPTGSGKTTTLYAALNFIKSSEINITTIEDPIEYNLEGINQTQIKPAINLTFASSLRAILRQDPNIIMVGEIRDKDTLENALRASLTGHLVFSTVHTNDAVSTITRLIDLGAEKFLLGNALKLIVAQRLVRKICPHCRTDDIDSNEQAAALALNISPDIKIYHGRGCDRCMSIGYWGRTAIYEMLPIDESIEKMISEGADRQTVLQYAKNQKINTLKDNGIDLIKEGITTTSEVLRETC